MTNRIAELRKKKGLTFAELGEAAGTSGQQIERLEKGQRKLTQEWMSRIASALGCKPIDLLVDEENAFQGPDMGAAAGRELAAAPRVATIHEFGGQEYGAIGVFDATASAGPGALNVDYPEPESYRLFPLNWLKAISGSAPETLAILSVAGDSMEPTLHNGDHILIDRAVQHLGRDGLYVIAADHETQVKRLSRDPRDRSITIRSDNPKAENWVGVDEERVHVLGRVLWLGRKING